MNTLIHAPFLQESEAEGSQKPLFAIVIPMKDEIDAVQDLLGGCAAAAKTLGPFEICVTDDGSSDGTDAALRDWARAHRHVSLSIISHPRAAGQSAAIHSAVHAASAPIIVTLDGDGQNPPDQIPKLLAPFLGAPNSRLGLVAGQRMKREDTLSKRVASRLANRLRGALLRDGTRDTGCGLKVFRRDAYLALPYFNHMHRFLPALFQRDGWTIAHIDVTHAPRRTGTSKYNNLSRALVGAVDLIGVVWLMRRGKRIAPDETTVTRGAEL